ncbi:MAG: hypothetical protein ACOX7N_08195 [Lawsonibacter sp.]|jgi:hypothetical protein
MRNRLVYGSWIFEDVQISQGNPYQEQTLFGLELGVDTLSVTVKCSDPAILKYHPNTRMIYYHRERQRGIYYVQSVRQVAPMLYAIYGVTAVGRLTKLEHRGGIYTGQSLEQVVREICGPFPVYVKSSVASISIYGWLPYVKPPDASARDNIALVLQATGTYLGVDMEGCLRVEPLWSGLAGTVVKDRICNNVTTELETPVSMVLVTEHQYSQGEEEQILFEGTATSQDPIIFDEPMHSLSATGFSIVESGANWARLSAGTGTLTGKSYIHTTRQVSAYITGDVQDNAESLPDNTLVTLVNSRDVANRMAAYYRCLKTIQAPIMVEGERPGQVVSIYDPFEKTMVKACIHSMDVNMSAVLKAETAALVDFEPPQSDSSEYIDERVVLTGCGEWTPPPGVTLLRYTLISGAFGGSAGYPGEPGGEAETYHYTSESGTQETGYTPGPGGKGGQGGTPGEGGKILHGEMVISNAAPISYQCGEGGKGSSDPNTPGTEGGPTIFGNISSDAGMQSELGYTDPVTGEVYAIKGKQGISGGDGAGKCEETGENPRYFLPASSVIDEDGVVWSGGKTETASQPGDDPQIVAVSRADGAGVYAVSGAGLGSGAAAGTAGLDGGEPGMVYASVDNPVARATASPGKDGASASLIPKVASLTIGGTGGYGGGGGSSCGCAVCVVRPSVSGADVKSTAETPGIGGLGYLGGEGGAGLIILYFRRPKPKQELLASVTKNSSWRLDKYGRRCIV